jgi:predicted transcriptional regulator
MIMSAAASPLTDKQLAAQALGRMPESASLEQICEELAILAAIRKAERAAAEGQLVSHEEVKQRSATWPGK